MATDFEKSIDSFQSRIDAKRLLLETKANEIKASLLDEKAIYDKKEALVYASTGLSNRYLNDTTLKDFPTIFNAARDRLDGDTIKVTSPYEVGYGGDNPKTETIRLGSSDPGVGLDTYEIAKLDAAGNVLPYNQNKFKYHAAHYARINQMPVSYVTQEMLNKEAEVQTNRLVTELYKGQTWDDYGVKPKIGEAVPYPKEVQTELDALYIELEQAKALQKERDATANTPTAMPKGTSGEAVNAGTALANMVQLGSRKINEIRSNVSVGELEHEIHKVKFYANESRPPIDLSLLTGDIEIDIRKDGVGIYDRDLGTLYSANTGENINTKLNTITNNAGYWSKYNKGFVENIRTNINKLELQDDPNGDGFISEIGYGLQGGVDNVQATGFAFAGLIMTMTGNQQLATRFFNRYLDNIDEAHSRGGKIPKVEDVDWTNGRQTLSKLGRTLGEGIPSIATMMGGAGVMKWLGNNLAKKLISRKMSDSARIKLVNQITKFSTYTGAFVPAFGMETGSIWGDVASRGETDAQAQWGSLSAGALAASLEALFPASFFISKGIKKGATSEIQDIFIKRLTKSLGNISKQTATGASTEAITEGLQFIVEDIAAELIVEGNLDKLNADEFVSGIINSMFAGAIPGGGLRLGTTTLSETAGGIGNIVDGDLRQSKKRTREIQQEARTAGNEALLDETETRSLDDVVTDSDNTMATVVKDVIKQTKDLKLEKIKNKSKIATAVDLLDQLNTVKDSSAPGTDTTTIDAQIVRLEESIGAYQSGSPEIQNSIQATVIKNKSNRDAKAINARFDIAESEANSPEEIASVQQARDEALLKVAIAETKAIDKIRRSKPVLKANRAKKDVLSAAVKEDIAKINRINEKLKDPKLSKAQKKRLNRQLQSLGRTVNTITNQNELAANLAEEAETALDSFDFRERVVIRTNNEAIDSAVKASEEVLIEVNSANNNVIVDPIEVSEVMGGLVVMYERLKELKNELLLAASKTTSKREQKDLNKQIRKVNTQIIKIEQAIKDNKTNREETTSEDKNTAEKEQEQASDILESLNINEINKEVKLPEKVKKNLSETEKDLLAIRERLYNLRVKLTAAEEADGTNTLVKVHKEVIEGNKRNKGVKSYLKIFGQNKRYPAGFGRFLARHRKKLKALEQALEQWDKKGDVNAAPLYVDQVTYEISEEATEKSWFVNDGTSKLIDYVKNEVAYLEQLDKYIYAIIANNDFKDTVKEAEDATKAMEDSIEAQSVDIEGESDLNSAEFEDAVEEEPIQAEEVIKPKTETAKPKEEVIPPTKAELEEKEKSASNNINILEATILKDQAELDTLKDNVDLGSKNKAKTLAYRIKANKELVTAFKKIQKQSLNKLEKIRQEQGILNNVLNKFTNDFFPLAKTSDSLLRVRDLFKVKDATRTSFFSENDSTTLTAETIRKKLIALGMDKDNSSKENALYVDTVAKMFTIFKKSLVTNILPNLDNINEKLQDGGVMALSNPQLLLSLQNGSIPDEVILAMMLSTMHWAAINQNITRNTPRYKIAAMLFDDPKQVSRISTKQSETFKNAGLPLSSAVRDISKEIFDTLNIAGEKTTEEDLIIRLDLAKLNPAFHDILSPDATIANGASTALALLAIEAGRYLQLPTNLRVSNKVEVKSKGKNGSNVFKNVSATIIEGGFIQFHHGRYDPTLFDNADRYGALENGKVTLNTIIVKNTNSTNSILEIFKDNGKNFEIIKGSRTILNDVYSEPVTEVQERTRNSFFDLPGEHTDVVEALQEVKHTAKEDLYPIFRALSTETLHELVEVKKLNEQHDESVEGVKASNEEKIRDVEIINDYVENNKNKGFFYRWNVMIQGRFQIMSNTINPQRSKIHRAFFYPDNPATVKTAADLAIFKLAVTQAFGFKLTTLAEAENQFNALLDENTSAGAIIKEILAQLEMLPKTKLESVVVAELNNLVIQLINEGTVKPSMHVIEGLVALQQYDANKEFVTTIGFETDGTTNGYAIALMQFAKGNVQTVIEDLKRVGFDASDSAPNEKTFESFIAKGSLDVYQYFSDTLYKKIEKLKLSAQDLDSITILHGEFFDETTKKLTKFARDLAKNPVMIANYGASIIKIINSVLDSIVPSLYDKLAKLQTEFNNADKAEQKLIRDKVQVIQNSLNTILKEKNQQEVNLVSRLNKKGSTKSKFNGKDYQNNLYGFIFQGKQELAVKLHFKQIYSEPFTQTLDDILGPIKESTDSIVKAAEAMHIIFMNEYTKAITYVVNGETKTISNYATKLAIAATLANKFMPRSKGVWSTSDADVMELINTSLKPSTNIQIFTQGIAQPVEEKTAGWGVLSDHQYSNLETLTFAPEFISPGVSAVIRMIQNIDSVLIGTAIKHNPKVIPIHDAIYSAVTEAIENAKVYNNKFKDIGITHSLLKDIKEQLQKTVNNLSKESKIEVEEKLKTDTFQIESLEKRLKRLKESKITPQVSKDILATAAEIAIYKDTVSLASIEEEVTRNIIEVADVHSKIDFANATSSQMYVPESAENIALKPSSEIENAQGTDTIDVYDDNKEVNTDQNIDIVNSQDDVLNANDEIDAINNELLEAQQEEYDIASSNNINTVPLVWEPLTKTKINAKTRAELLEIAKGINVAVEDNATKAKIIQRITDHQNGIPQEPVKPVTLKFTNNLAFINYVKALGGINPESTLAAELKSQDILPKSMPGLFRKNSKTGNLDNIPVVELQAADLFPEEDDNGYASVDWVIDRIVEEVAGNAGLTDINQNAKEQNELELQQYEEDLAEYKIAKAKTDIDEQNSEVLGSLEQEVTEELKQIYTTRNLRISLLSIFDKIGMMHSQAFFSKADKDTQQKHLKRVLKDIVGRAGPILDSTTVTLFKGRIKTGGHANITNNSVRVNINKFAPRAYAQQNGQEVYTHELIHILTRFILKNDSSFRTDVKRIRQQVKREIERTEERPYEIFLHRDKDGNVIFRRDEASEIESAKEQYDYVFVKPPADAVLDEFLAYALTNKFLVAKLKSMPASKVPLWNKNANDKPSDVVEKLFDLFAEMLKRFGDLLRGKNKSRNLEEEIFNLTKEIVEVNQSKRNKISDALYADKVGKFADQSNQILSDFIKQYGSKGFDIASEEYKNLVNTLTKDGKMTGFVANALYSSTIVALLTKKNQELIENDSKIQKVLATIYGKFNSQTLLVLSSLKTDVLQNIDQDFIQMLYRSNKLVDANRKAHKEISQKEIRKKFKDYESLTKEDKEAITRVVFKTDLAVLIETNAFTIEEVMGLISNPVLLKEAIAKYSKGLTKYQLLQSKGLADYMLTNKTEVSNQWLNANNIYVTNPKGSKADVITNIDIYVTLLALNQTAQGAKELFTVIEQREFNLDSKVNGISSLLNLHTEFKKDSLERGFSSNPVLMQKGYISQITDTDVSLRVEFSDTATQLKMKAAKYKFIGNFHNIEGLDTENYGLYVLNNDPDSTRTKSILSMTAMRAFGEDFLSIKDRKGDSKGQMKEALAKFVALQTKNSINQNKTGQTTKGYKMIPLPDEDLNIVNYRISLRQNELENHLNQNLEFDEILPTMYSQTEDKINSELVNKEAIKLMDQYRKTVYKKNPKAFINILDPKYQEEYFQPLPKQAKYEIMQRARFNKKLGQEEFLVERGYLDVIFGYINPSLSSLVPTPREGSKFAIAADTTKRRIKVGEKAIKELVNIGKISIVIKIPIVPAANFTSNFITSWMYGVPPWYLAKKWYEGVKELKSYQTMAEEVKAIDLEMISNPAQKTNSALKLKRATLVADMNKNKVAPFIDMGLFNSITEDINQNEFTYRNKFLTKFREKGSKLVTGKVMDIANQAYLGENTAIFKASMHFLQISDFIARYALYEYQTKEKGMDKKKAYQQMIQTFVNYDQPLNRYLGYTNDMGLILFVKYWIRIQRAGLNLIIEKPLNAALLFSGNSLLGLDIETILNSSLITGNFFPTLGGFEKILEEVIIPPGLEILSGEGF